MKAKEKAIIALTLNLQALRRYKAELVSITTCIGLQIEDTEARRKDIIKTKTGAPKP